MISGHGFALPSKARAHRRKRRNGAVSCGSPDIFMGVSAGLEGSEKDKAGAAEHDQAEDWARDRSRTLCG